MEEEISLNEIDSADEMDDDGMSGDMTTKK